MNEQDIRSESRKYLDEMMRFYAMNKNASVSAEKTPEPPRPADAEQSEHTLSDNSKAEIKNEPDISGAEINEPAWENTDTHENSGITEEAEFESRFPIPVIPDFIRSASPKPEIPAVTTAEGSEYGYLKIEVRTGENGLPVPEAAVTVSEKNGRSENIIFTGITDQSGAVSKISLPAPLNRKDGSPESFGNYSVYTVSVFAKGFYREISADVPVFAGITSIQRFDLIPVPFNYDDKGQSILTENTEPEI